MKPKVFKQWADIPKDFTGIAKLKHRLLHMVNGELHRDDGPAIVWTNYPESFSWYQNGKRHREFAPATIWAGEEGGWWLEGKCFLNKKNYWKKLYEKYKGTDKEELVLSHLLGAK